MNKVKMAIVGAGIWGENHARIYNAHPFAETVALCDGAVIIPMSPRAESFNAAVAASILMWEFARAELLKK